MEDFLLAFDFLRSICRQYIAYYMVIVTRVGAVNVKV